MCRLLIMAHRKLMKLSGYLTELIMLYIYNGFSEEEVQTLSVMADKVEKNLWEAIKNEEQK